MKLGDIPLSISVNMRTIRFWASLNQSPVPHCSTDVNFAMRGFFERDIVRSPWLDHVEQILIISGFDCVWESEPLRCSLYKRIRHNFRKYSYIEIEDGNKCLFYRHFKTTYR